MNTMVESKDSGVSPLEFKSQLHYWQCDLGQDIQPFCVLVSSTTNWIITPTLEDLLQGLSE